MPPIRSTRAADGAEIAFYALGRGPVCVVLFPYHVSHLELNWQVALHRHGLEFLAERFTVVALDPRGSGLSARRVEGLSLDSMAGDIEAVLAAMRIERTAICAMGPSALIALRFAARAPSCVSNLVFIQAGESETNRQLLSLRALNPDVEARLRGVMIGGDDSPSAIALGATARAALDGEVLRQWEQVLSSSNAIAVASGVDTPALFLHAVDDDVIPLEAGQVLASSMANARFVPVAEAHPMQIWGNGEALDAMREWLAEGFGMRLPRRRSGRSAMALLTDRETEVLQLLASGKTNRQIAAALSISTNTVSHHLRGIFAKTASTNRTEAAAFAHANRLARPVLGPK
jgi:DNA-binding CsgD family transcriptional regulator/pimeloyl-ACP methyl ester carboxylesterase